MSAFGIRVAHRVTGPVLLRSLGGTVTGRGHVPGHGGVLLAANHRSFFDHFILGAASPRPMRFLGKASLATGLSGRFNLAMGMIPLQRGSADLAALDAVVDALRAGDVVGVFPEGTRSRTGELYRFRSGLARIAANAGVPTVPVGLLGTAEAWAAGLRSVTPGHRGRVAIHFGALVSPPAATGRARRAFTAEVHTRVAALCGQPLADHFAPLPDADAGGAGGP